MTQTRQSPQEPPGSARDASRGGTARAASGGAGGSMRVRVIGSGPVALAFAAFLRRQGLPARSIELTRNETPPAPALAARVLALSLGSWQLLSRIARLPAAAPIGSVDVAVSGLPGRARIDAREMNVPALGYVVRYTALLEALSRGLEALDGAAARGTRVATVPQGAAGPAAGSGPHELVVHAEGDTGQDASELVFAQAALLAEIEVDGAQAGTRGGTAFECFTADGPLALLPLPEPRRYALVWCDRPELSQRRAELGTEALADELQQAFGWRLGRLRLTAGASVAPMVRRARRELASGNEVWIGNAAQMLHPVAGQGLNLGMRDAFVLARCIGEAAARGLDGAQALRRYERQRRTDRSGTIALTDTLARVFSLQPLRPLQSLTLAALDLSPAARDRLARHFMFGLR